MLKETKTALGNPLQETYKGHVNPEGARIGKGVLQWGNSDIYDGEFKNGLRHGIGKYEEKGSGQTYTGSYISSQRSNGTLTFPNGDVYTGEFMDDKFSGYGVLKTKVIIYKGEWMNGRRHGHGLLTFMQTRDRYEGLFEKNLFHGYGRYIWGDGRRYTGEWQNGERHGYGITIHPEGGDGHEGNYRHNKKDGKGWSKKNMRYREGLWKEDEFVRWLGVEQNRKTESKLFQHIK